MKIEICRYEAGDQNRLTERTEIELPGALVKPFEQIAGALERIAEAMEYPSAAEVRLPPELVRPFERIADVMEWMSGHHIEDEEAQNERD